VRPAPGGDAGSYRSSSWAAAPSIFPAVFAALDRAAFDGWVVAEPDAVSGPTRTPKESAAISKRYLEGLGFHIRVGVPQAERRPRGPRRHSTIALTPRRVRPIVRLGFRMLVAYVPAGRSTESGIASFRRSREDLRRGEDGVTSGYAQRAKPIPMPARAPAERTA